MPAFDRVWEYEVDLVYGWEDDMSLEYRVTFPGPITPSMTKEDDAIPWGIMRGDRTFVFKSQEIPRLEEREEAKKWLVEFCDENRLDLYAVIEWALDTDGYLMVGDNERGGDAAVQCRETIHHQVAILTGKATPNAGDKYYGCAC